MAAANGATTAAATITAGCVSTCIVFEGAFPRVRGGSSADFVVTAAVVLGKSFTEGVRGGQCEDEVGQYGRI